MSGVGLREVAESDVLVSSGYRHDPGAVRMAAFTSADPSGRAAFPARWERILADDSVVARTVVSAGGVVGHVSRYVRSGAPGITCRPAPAHRGKGPATAAPRSFLRVHRVGPLFARAAVDNAGSLRVPAECGFAAVGRDVGFAEGRGGDVEQLVLGSDG